MSSLDLMQLVARVSLFDLNVKMEKDPGDEFGPYAFVQDLC